MFRTCLCFAFLLLASRGYGQQFGGNTASLKWEVIRLDHANIIYPRDQPAAAQRAATILTRVNALADSSIGTRRRHVNIILQKETTISNGYVSLAPFRSEFMLTAPANPFEQGSLDWIDQLSLHEYRHVEQYSNYNKGLARVFSILLGQQGQALANALSVPDWFFEGDAVYQETLLSRQGRGRLPSFFDGYRSLWEAGTHYSYMKLRNGSYKDYVPGHYDLGYQLVAYGRDRYGDAFWQKVTGDAAAMRGLFYPLQRSIRKNTGMRFSAFTEAALENSRQRLGVTVGTAGKLPPVLEEENPVYMENGDLLLLKSTYTKVRAFYRRTAAGDQQIRVKDRSLDAYFSYANGFIVYSAYVPDVRYGWKDYAELRLLDVHNGRQENLTRHTKYFTPALSPGADSIVALWQEPGKDMRLDILDRSGKLLHSVPNPNHYRYAHPSFAGRDILVAARKRSGEMNLLLVDPLSGTETLLLDWQQAVIGYPRLQETRIYFTATRGGRDRLFSCRPDGSGLEQIETQASDSSRTGAYQPTVQQSRITWMQFTATGHKLLTETISRTSPAEAEELTAIDPLALRRLTVAEEVSTRNSDTAVAFVHERYPKSSRLFQFHSWTPYYEEPEFSFSVMSQNPLNTLQSDLNFVYNRNERFKQFGFDAVFGGWFPFVSAGAHYTIDRTGNFQNRRIHWNETELSLGLSLPLNLSRGRSLRYLSAGAQLVYSKAWFREPEKSVFGDPQYYYLDYGLRFSNQSLQARMQFNPPFAQTLRLHYRQAIRLFDSKQLLATANFYFPGLAPTHSLVLNGAAQGRDSTNGIRFTDEMPFARGYAGENYYRSIKWGVNYGFPLCYPDAGLFQIVYLMRLRLNLYYDHAYAQDVQLLKSTGFIPFRSTGLELFIDSKWWNQLPVSFGIRYARLLDPDMDGYRGANRFEFILPLNLLPGGVNKTKAKPGSLLSL